MADAAIIFDVDGVLLELTQAEEDAFFYPFEALYSLTGLSRDWDSYRVRNDKDIITEILEKHLARPPHQAEYDAVVATYIGHAEQRLANGALKPKLIPGARGLLEALVHHGVTMGIATANLLDIARLRLEAMGLWTFVAGQAGGADGGGHKRDVLARVIANIGLAPNRVVYLGDNVNDVDAGLHTGVHFIGFAMEEPRRQKLKSAGAASIAATHAQSLELIRRFLGR
jgi:phosphoglycolate phosphatase-like HAD superfamily hydrolase